MWGSPLLTHKNRTKTTETPISPRLPALSLNIEEPQLFCYRLNCSFVELTTSRILSILHHQTSSPSLLQGTTFSFTHPHDYRWKHSPPYPLERAWRFNTYRHNGTRVSLNVTLPALTDSSSSNFITFPLAPLISALSLYPSPPLALVSRLSGATC